MSLHGFNLLQDNTTPPDMWDKIYDWINNVGRVVVMVVEIVVIISFGARVVIDTQANNLMEREGVLAASLEAFRQKELQFEDMQERFRNYRLTWSSASNYSPMITTIINDAPTSVENFSVEVSGTQINIKGFAPVTELQEYEAKLKSSNSFQTVEVVEVEDSASDSRDNRVNFSITIGVTLDQLNSRQDIDLAVSGAGPSSDQANQSVSPITP